MKCDDISEVREMRREGEEALDEKIMDDSVRRVEESDGRE
jgi:hypothetical protein